MKVALLSTIYGHGKILADVGTEILSALQKNPYIKSIDVLTVKRASSRVRFDSKTNVMGIYSPGEAISYISLYWKLFRNKYDLIFINSMPTSQGRSSLSNFLFLIIPLYARFFLQVKTVVLYHNSTFLNEVDKLGYSSIADRFRLLALKALEKILFKNSNFMVLLKCYAERIKQSIPDANIFQINLPFLGGFASLYLNGILGLDFIRPDPPHKGMIRILLFGSWGPQKDLEKALEAISDLKKSGLNFTTTLAGGVNSHFPEYERVFKKIILRHKGIITTLHQYVDSKEIHSLFLNSDLIILPYVTPGGFSSVLAISKLYNLHVIVPKFTEFIEQGENYDKITYVPISYTVEDLRDAIRHVKIGNQQKIMASEAFNQMVEEINNLILKFNC